jgi:hypothetical protein
MARAPVAKAPALRKFLRDILIDFFPMASIPKSAAIEKYNRTDGNRSLVSSQTILVLFYHKSA